MQPRLAQLWTSWRAWTTRHPWSAWLLAIVFALIFGSGLFRCPTCIGLGDWDYFNAWSLVARRSIVEHHELPLWNPYACGGMSVPANFQSRAYSPSFAFVLVFGPIVGNRLWALVMLAVGFEGARRLAREYGAGAVGATFAGLAIAGNGGIALRLAAGHLADLPYLLIPWSLLVLRRAWASPSRWALAGAAIVALSFVEGGMYPVVYGSMLGGFLSLIRVAEEKRARPLFAFVAIVVGGVALAMPVVLPSLQYLASNVRRSVDVETIPWSGLASIFLGTRQTFDGFRRFADQRWWWHEYGTYVGPLFPLAIVIGFRRSEGAPRRELWILGAMGALFVWIALGAHGPWSPWELLHRLPVGSSMRASGRAFLVAVICFAIVAAFGVDRLGRFAIPFTIAFAATLAFIGIPLVHHAFPPTFAGERALTPFVQRRDDRHRRTMTEQHFTTMMQDVQGNVGTLQCYEPTPPTIAAQPTSGDVDTPLLLGTGSASIARRTNNRIDVALTDVNAPATVVVDVNYARGWETTDDGSVGPINGLLAARVAPGSRNVTFVFRPIEPLAGLACSLIALLLLWRARAAALERAGDDSGFGPAAP